VVVVLARTVVVVVTTTVVVVCAHTGDVHHVRLTEMLKGTKIALAPPAKQPTAETNLASRLR
jgi:hypothetical protein